jgi:FtsP/CotA-like multicopper oxidase with cupredoxin domain
LAGSAALTLLAGCSAVTHTTPAAVSFSEASASPSPAAGGPVRTYWISSDPVDWNYAPTGRNEITGADFTDTAKTYVGHGPGQLGPILGKCLYRAYTPEFEAVQSRPESEAYLGDLGPTIRAVVGDTIVVHFRNTCAFPTTMHPHGVEYTKDSEGSPYNDGTSGEDKADDDVPTNGQHTYVWHVPDRSGPGPMEGSSVGWMYHSHSDEIGDIYAGLSGFLVVTARGQARPDATPKDVDQEVFSLFEVDDESQSPLLADNIKRFLHGARLSEDDFAESNKRHSINGYLYGGGPMVTLHQGTRVRWYLMGMGTEVDLHTPHWHGNDVLVNGMRTDVVSLLPATMVTADMVPDAVGTWLYHCHVGDHITAGMVTRYRVE